MIGDMGQHEVQTVILALSEWLGTLPPNQEVRVQSGLEKEAKFFEFDLDHLSRRLELQGAKQQPTTLLTTIRYDTAERLLKKHDHVVRLRLHNRNFEAAELTYKGPKVKHPAGLKVRLESTRAPLKFTAASRFLIDQGLEATSCIEKLRTNYVLPGACVSVDEYPNGTSLLEIEAREERTIFELSAALHLQLDKQTSDVGERKALRYLYGADHIPSQIVFPEHFSVSVSR